MNEKYINYKNLIILDGVNTHPGSGNLNCHSEEIKIFEKICDDIQVIKNPVMIEIGCFWSLWSLIFKNKFKNAKNILIDLSKRALDVGETNFKLNNFDYISYHGGFFIENSGTFHNSSLDINYLPEKDHYYNESLNEKNFCGENLDFKYILNSNNISQISLLHMDIQGSEQKFIEYLNQENYLLNIENLIVCTHSVEIHENIINIVKFSHNLKINLNNIGGDGYLHFTLKEDL